MTADGCRIVLATPHPRYDALEMALRQVHGLEVLRIRQREALSAEALQVMQARWVFLPHWSWLVPPSVHGGFECVIFHMTDLPFGRGGSPLQNLIVRGLGETRLSAIRCEAALDSGPVYCKRPLSLDGTAEQIFARAARLMEGMIVEIVRGRSTPLPQTGEPTLFQRRTPKESDISALADLDRLYDHIRMLDAEGYPHAFLRAGALRLEFTGAERDGDHVHAAVRISLVVGDSS
jgi:methionyl-tRNA formyltransferase